MVMMMRELQTESITAYEDTCQEDKLLHLHIHTQLQVYLNTLTNPLMKDEEVFEEYVYLLTAQLITSSFFLDLCPRSPHMTCHRDKNITTLILRRKIRSNKKSGVDLNNV